MPSATTQAPGAQDATRPEGGSHEKEDRHRWCSGVAAYGVSQRERCQCGHHHCGQRAQAALRGRHMAGAVSLPARLARRVGRLDCTLRPEWLNSSGTNWAVPAAAQSTRQDRRRAA